MLRAQFHLHVTDHGSETDFDFDSTWAPTPSGSFICQEWHKLLVLTGQSSRLAAQHLGPSEGHQSFAIGLTRAVGDHAIGVRGSTTNVRVVTVRVLSYKRILLVKLLAPLWLPSGCTYRSTIWINGTITSSKYSSYLQRVRFGSAVRLLTILLRDFLGSYFFSYHCQG